MPESEQNPNPVAAIDLRNVHKRYGDITALHDVSLAIRDNEFFTLLGPSGCGKTTLLRIIAGFEDLNGGELFLHGKPMADKPTHKRPVNTVFQQYALFPHMTVFDNVAFGLRMLKRPEDRVQKRVTDMLELTHLGDFAKRLPAQLSGGQQQRVAVARALAPEPEVLLLDESLSALDLKLRQAMRLELKRIQRETGITFVFVTHDQDEALTMSDRIAVMSDGRVQQIGTPTDIYDTPVNCFVADFIGETNLLRGAARQAADGGHEFVLEGGHSVPLPPEFADATVVSIRPERIALTGGAAPLRGAVTGSVYIGAVVQVFILLENDGPTLTATDMSGRKWRVGDAVGLSVDRSAVHAVREE